jgi:hypothetical protein
MGAASFSFHGERKMSEEIEQLLLDVATRIDRQLELHQPNAGFKQPGPEIVSACLRSAVGNLEPPNKELEHRAVQAETALLEALAHVRRQQHGKHEQDRQDAEKWLSDWEPLIRKLRSET